MDELKYLTNKNNIQQITVGLQKLCKSIRAAKAVNTKDNQIKEIDFLRELCTSEYSNLSLLAHQCFARLVEDGTLESAACLTMFITMLPNARYNQHIVEGVMDLLLLDLKRRSILQELYICPFGIKVPQHPIIMLLRENKCNVNDLTLKINGICNHHDREIRRNSIEFLRPVFLYILCTPAIISDASTIWTCLLSQTKHSNKAMELVEEILCWSKTSTAMSTLKTSILLSEAINMIHNELVIQFSFYLTAVLNDLLTYGYDPRSGFRIFLQAISKMNIVDNLSWNLLLVLLSQSLQNVSPVYLPDVVRLLKFIIITKCGGNRITRSMILDGIIIWIANYSFVSQDTLHDIKELLEFIIKPNVQHSSPRSSVTQSTMVNAINMKFSHPSITIGMQLADLSQRIDDDLNNGKSIILTNFIESIQTSARMQFNNYIHLFLRGIFINNTTPTHLWMKIFEILLQILQENQDVAIGLILPVLFKLSRESVPDAQLKLLRGLTQFAVIKENIPTILNTINKMTSETLRPLSLDLYLRLWKTETRTYPFLHKLLNESYEKDKNSLELNVAKASTIKEICELKPTQHGADLVVHLSNILNQSHGIRGETQTTVVMEAIIILCESHTINIASTWKALRPKFHNEKRKRAIVSLCKFFGLVPLLRSPTLEYEEFHAEAIKELWGYIVNYDNSEIITAALKALRNFDLNEFTLSQIPDIFQQNIILPSEYAKTPIDGAASLETVLSYVPGECWLQLIQNVNHSAIEAAADLVSHYIFNEIDSYRSGVYQLPEGRPERNSLRQLSKSSPLRFVVDYLINDTTANELVSLNCLRCLSKKFPKPIPPLDMYFLLKFMDNGVEMRKYCVQILANQVMQSGTAKNLLENYLASFGEEKFVDFEEVEVVLDVMIELINGVSTDVMKNFIEMLFDYAFRKSSNTLLIAERLFESIKIVFTEKCCNEVAPKMIADIIQSYFEMIYKNEKIFSKFMVLCEVLPSSVLDTLSSPDTWSEVTPEKFAKATLIRCHLAANNIGPENSLTWLNPIVDNVAKYKIDDSFVLRNIGRVLHGYENNKNLCNWTMEIQSKVQANLIEKSAHISANVEFSMDLLTLCIVFSSGCSTVYGNLDDLATCRQTRLNGFPMAMYLLCDQTYWKDCAARIFEFLYYIYTNTDLRSCYTDAAKNALICTKNHFYFTQNNNWMKYIGLKR